MKIKNFLPILFAVALVGCSSDDGPNTPPVEPESNYFPLTVGNSWTYDNERTVGDETPEQSKETMTVAGSEEKNGSTFYEMNSATALEGGLTTSILANGELAKINDELIYNGSYSVSIPGFDPVVLPIIGAAVFSSTANAGTELSKISDSVERDIEIQGQIIPVTVAYTLTTTNKGFLDSYTAGGKAYKDVLQADLVVSASVSAKIGPLVVDLLTKQNVVTITNYYANETGLIMSNAVIDYEFEDLSAFGVPAIPNVHIESTQEIYSYSVIDENIE